MGRMDNGLCFKREQIDGSLRSGGKFIGWMLEGILFCGPDTEQTVASL